MFEVVRFGLGAAASLHHAYAERVRLAWILDMFDDATDGLAEPSVEFEPPSNQAVTDLFGFPPDTPGGFEVTEATVGQIEVWTGRSIDLSVGQVIVELNSFDEPPEPR